MNDSRIFYNWLVFIQQQLCPPLCSLCGSRVEGHQDLCAPCLHELPHNLSPCRQCGLPLEGNEVHLCGRCLKKSPPFDRAIIPFLYKQPLDKLILSLKFHHGLAHARLLGELLADAVVASESRPQMIIPVPLHPQRLRERGYNQALEIARPIARQLAIPLSLNDVQRIRHTESQTRLDNKARHKNLSGAFLARGTMPEHIAIVDDVVTGGSTVTALATSLKKSGVKQVDIWAAARSVRT